MEKVKKKRTVEEGRAAYYASLTPEEKTKRAQKMARARWNKQSNKN
jgi:hypothetical protein